MGATDFRHYHAGASLRSAYNEAVSEATREWGSEPYNGSISTTQGYRQVVSAPMTHSGAELYAEAHIDDAQKWGEALAIPIAEDSDFALSQATFSITLPAATPVLDWDGNPTGRTEQTSRYTLIEAGRKEALRRYSNRVYAVAVADSLKTKVVVDQPAQGRSVTRWVFDKVGRTTYYDTKAQAIKAAKAALAAGEWKNEIAILAVRYFPEAGTEAAARVKRVTVSAVATVTVTLATPKTARPTIAGWLFFGLAAI